MRRRKNNKQRKILVFSAMALLLIMTAGYAAFNTQINITAKGNIVKKKAAQQLIANVVDTGDGLYADSVTEGRYFYRGTTVDNYIIFNNETWRIISVEADGTLKIIRNEQLSDILAFDEDGTRDSSTSTYCKSSTCNAWAATSNLVGTPSVFTQYSPNGNSTNDTTTYSGTVTTDASSNTYLNGEYYNSLSSTAQSQIVEGKFNVSTPGNEADTESLDIDVAQEKQYQWQGKVALMTVTELLRASTNSGCTSLSAGKNSRNSSPCSLENWLWPTFNTSNSEGTVSPGPSSPCSGMWFVDSGGYIFGRHAFYEIAVRPVVHLSSDITLDRSGTQSSPYIINGGTGN